MDKAKGKRQEAKGKRQMLKGKRQKARTRKKAKARFTPPWRKCEGDVFAFFLLPFYFLSWVFAGAL